MGITNKKSLNKISLLTDFISQLQENGFDLLYQLHDLTRYINPISMDN